MAGRNPRERFGEFGPKLAEVPLHPTITADQHMIGAANAARGQHFPRERPQSALHPVANNRVTDLFSDGEADAHPRIAIGPVAYQQDETRHRRPLATVRREKIRAAGQGRNGGGRLPGGYADSFLRPRARRARITERPPTVAIRVRKP